MVAEQTAHLMIGGAYEMDDEVYVVLRRRDVETYEALRLTDGDHEPAGTVVTIHVASLFSFFSRPIA